MSFVANLIRFPTVQKFQKNRLRFDKVIESFKMGTFFETQCRYLKLECHVVRLSVRSLAWPGAVVSCRIRRVDICQGCQFFVVQCKWDRLTSGAGGGRGCGEGQGLQSRAILACNVWQCQNTKQTVWLVVIYSKMKCYYGAVLAICILERTSYTLVNFHWWYSGMKTWATTTVASTDDMTQYVILTPW